MTDDDDRITLSEAKADLRDKVMGGGQHTCPCCSQTAAIYRRQIHSGIAWSFIMLYRAAGTDWAHWPTVRQENAAAQLASANERGRKALTSKGRDEAMLQYWGLVEDAELRRDDGGKRGIWRVTALGADFIRERVEIQKYAHVYDRRVLTFSGPMVTIKDCLADAFALDELLRVSVEKWRDDKGDTE